MDKNTRIPIPLKQHWLDARMRLVPALVFLGSLAAIAFLWKGYVAAPTLLGQAESIQQNVSSYKPGMLTELDVTRFQKVKAGDHVGVVMVTDARILTASLAVITAEIEALRLTMQPVASQQRTVVGYDQLRLDWMKERALLATARVNLQLAETEAHRMDELFKEKIVAQRVFEQAQAARDRLRSEVSELNRLVDEQERNFTQIQITNIVDIGQTTNSPLRAAMAVQESKLRLTEAEMSPITLIAPVDGMVSTIFHRAGESIIAGDPVIAIATANSTRIIGYLRSPLMTEPVVGMGVEVRTRNQRREAGSARIIDIGSQMEPISAVLQPMVKASASELGLPISISLPANLKIRPGELVDLTLIPASK